MKNVKSLVSLATMQGSAKGTLRGHLIAYASSKKKPMEAHRLDLEKDLECSEKVHKQSPDRASRSQLKTAKLNLEYS
jgi:hypothetical protein